MPFTSGNSVVPLSGLLATQLFSVSSQSRFVLGSEKSVSELECFPRQRLNTVRSPLSSVVVPSSVGSQAPPPSSLTPPTLSTSLPKSAVSAASSSIPVEATNGLRSESKDPRVFTLIGVGGLCGEIGRPPSLNVLQRNDSVLFSSPFSTRVNGGSSCFIM